MVAPGGWRRSLALSRSTTIPLRTKTDPVSAAAAASPKAKCTVAGAVEVENDAPGRLRLAANEGLLRRPHCMASSPPTSPRAQRSKPTARRALPAPPTSGHKPHLIGAVATHAFCPWVRRAFSNAKTWAPGVCHGHPEDSISRATSMNSPSRFNRRRTRYAAFPLASRNRPHPKVANLQHVDHAGSSGVGLRRGKSFVLKPLRAACAVA